MIVPPTPWVGTSLPDRVCVQTLIYTQMQSDKNSHHLHMQVFHLANLIHLSESGNVLLCGLVTHWAYSHGDSPRGVLKCVFASVCACVHVSACMKETFEFI